MGRCRHGSCSGCGSRRNIFVISAVIVSILTIWVWIRLLQKTPNMPPSYMTPVFDEPESYDPWRIDFWDNEKIEQPSSPTCQPTQLPRFSHPNFPVLKGPRDGSLRALADLLNSRGKLFDNWQNSASDYTGFIQALTPWILSPPAYPIRLSTPNALWQQLPPLLKTNCNETRYASVLSGRPLPIPRVIVDFIPFEYDAWKYVYMSIISLLMLLWCSKRRKQ